jgi:hypothetical protein
MFGPMRAEVMAAGKKLHNGEIQQLARFTNTIKVMKSRGR